VLLLLQRWGLVSNNLHEVALGDASYSVLVVC
jgi:hypothetical protein